jgi:hypothetical protein
MTYAGEPASSQARRSVRSTLRKPVNLTVRLLKGCAFCEFVQFATPRQHAGGGASKEDRTEHSLRCDRQLCYTLNVFQ